MKYHKAKLFGFIPAIYIEEIDEVRPANWVPEWFISLVSVIFFKIEAILNYNNPYYEPGFPVKVDSKVFMEDDK